MQWRNEIEAHTEGLKVLVWHGASRESNIKELKKYDVVCSCCFSNSPNSDYFSQVLTTYAVLERLTFIDLDV